MFWCFSRVCNVFFFCYFVWSSNKRWVSGYSRIIIIWKKKYGLINNEVKDYVQSEVIVKIAGFSWNHFEEFETLEVVRN
jgi:hypothetical protein